MGGLILYLVGIMWIIFGALALFAPEIIRKKFIDKMKKVPLKKLCIAPVIVGILLLVSASQHTNPFIIIVFGLLGIAKGAFGIIATDRAERINDWWFNKANNNVYRIAGVVTIILGSVVLMGI